VTFEERLAALEKAVADLLWLPKSLASLMRKLERDWQPDAAVLLQAGSVTEDAIADGAVTPIKASAAKGQATITGTGASFADVTVTDNLGTSDKYALALHHEGGTYTSDVVICKVQSTATNTTTFRVLTRNVGNITLGETVFIDYEIWKA
jgi:hypothetical protein